MLSENSLKKQPLNQIIPFLVSFGLPITRISKDFSLSRSTVYRIVKGEHKKSDPLEEEKIKDIAESFLRL